MILVTAKLASGRSTHETSNGISYRSDLDVATRGAFGGGSADRVVAHGSVDRCGIASLGHLRP
jgi:hypothetical protein